MVVYSLKEKLKIRDADSTLPELDDMAFLRDLGLTAEDNGQVKLTIAGLLFERKGYFNSEIAAAGGSDLFTL